LCRWQNSKTKLDVMPLDSKILGFSNRWYKPAMRFAEFRELKHRPDRPCCHGTLLLRC